MINVSILLTTFGYTMNTWNEMTQRFSDSKLLRKGRVIDFKGTQKDFDDLMDRLCEDESNFKVIGVYENNKTETV